MRLIDADAAKQKILEEATKVVSELSVTTFPIVAGLINLFDCEDDLPTIEAEPVRHGEWAQSRSPGGSPLCNCSVCGESAISQDNDWGDVIDYHETDFCPNCGAKMDGGIPDETVHDKK